MTRSHRKAVSSTVPSLHDTSPPPSSRALYIYSCALSLGEADRISRRKRDRVIAFFHATVVGGDRPVSRIPPGDAAERPPSPLGSLQSTPSPVFHYFLVFEFDINCRCGLVTWQLRLFLIATFLVDYFLYCCGPLQNTCTEKSVEGSSSSIIINKTRTFVWFLSFPGKDLSIYKNTNGKSCGDFSSIEFKQHCSSIELRTPGMVQYKQGR
ncbi:hypothetical protein L2E82_02259 [Cichorium intybus]|uniref:Uncharacterized protein n=1 Tax=Cichorium intybus TaxID=13427 RepID=A0ACB9H1Y8_CICIN|nr:hypothetical protein L2E82_02259 [Cichorium intybus]